jgi:alpha-galactosidase
MSKAPRVSLLSAAGVAVLASVLAFCATARAAQTAITISMAAPPATPRIQPPLTIGANPATPFLYTIPATGQAPLTFAATGLPSGLTLSATSGTI